MLNWKPEMKQILCAAFLTALAARPFSAQGAGTTLSYTGGGNYTLVERTDLRRYDNGKYTGLMSRETRSFISRSEAPAGFSGRQSSGDRWYDGSFYVTEKTQRAARSVAEGVHDSVAAVFRITKDGRLFMYEDNGYPSFRSFPAFPQKEIRPGDSWQAEAERAADPLNKGVVTRMPMLVEYTYVNDEEYHGEPVCRLSAKWATRYGISYTDPSGDRDLTGANGSHSAFILVSRKTGSAILVQDTVNETFVYADKGQIQFKGTISLFTEYPPAVNRDRIIPALQRAALISSEDAARLAAAAPSGAGTPPQGAGAPPSGGKKPAAAAAAKRLSDRGGESGGGNITVENTAAGIRLTIRDLQFKADSAELLSGEQRRLADIASVLKEAPDASFLVEGHTASTGNPRGEQTLSEERAHAIAEALSECGIPSGKFICRGSGSRKPAADNSSPEGRARNRRVEITILE